jgi:ABC-type polysaccharide/polyol phosphate export permease
MSKSNRSPIYRTADTRIAKAWRDLKDGIMMSDLWLEITVRDFLSLNRRRFFGWLWVPLGMIILVYTLGYAYSYILQYDYLDFTLYLFAGLVSWSYIQTVVTSSFNLFVREANTILNVSMPFSYFVFKMVFTNLLPAIISLPFYFLANFIYGHNNYAEVLLLIPGLTIYIMCGISLGFLMGTISVRFRDLESPVANIMRLLFLITPVIWMIEGREGSLRADWAFYNPFYHILEITRAPLLGVQPTLTNWTVSLGVLAILAVAASVSFIRFRHRIAYWL